MKTFFGLLGFAIFLLALVVLSALFPHGHGSKETKSQTRVQSVAVALSQLSGRETLGSYPPTGAEALGRGLTAGNELNRGVESVFVAVHLQEFVVPLDVSDEALANTDGDTFLRNVTSTDSVERWEIVDAWGNPLAYFHSDDYAKPDRFTKIRMSEELGGQVVEARPWKRPATGLFINPRTFQLFSAGADGVFNTADDLGNWERSRPGGTPIAPVDSPGSGAR